MKHLLNTIKDNKNHHAQNLEHGLIEILYDLVQKIEGFAEFKEIWKCILNPLNDKVIQCTNII